ncbi:MAG: VWA domain-containing protein [Cyclobacteriaceae bacterium]|nr:VWA domain-containing protein [Cyclobacteriaceae bacterium]MCX7637315.1 VWA domain-containing protein [Cyclobacteriaceae bacterium]MDW8331106.1 VWA domain-containing protein [Cyclobacteriaceae bacterium]
MKGFRFLKYTPGPGAAQSDFDRLLSVFLKLLLITSGDANEALQWLTEADRQYKLTTDQYGIGDFIEDLKRKGYISEDPQTGKFSVQPKTERSIRQSALEEIFGRLKKSRRGEHNTVHTGKGDEPTAERRSYSFGDSLEQIAVTESLKNAQINHGTDDFHLTEDDLEIIEQEFKAQTSTVLLIDISHSMILYGEDRITPAKQVALALAELIRIKYPKDTLDFVAFGDDARPIELKDIPYLQVGPYHTNTVAALEMAMDILRRRKNPNKQIFMITDGKPTCIKQGINYYKNPFGLDKKIISRTLALAAQLRRLKIPVTTFMIASDPYLKAFVREFTRVNNGNAYYSSLEGLGHLVFEDFRRNRVKHF